jgi:hypothetical protein
MTTEEFQCRDKKLYRSFLCTTAHYIRDQVHAGKGEGCYTPRVLSTARGLVASGDETRSDVEIDRRPRAIIISVEIGKRT